MENVREYLKKQISVFEETIKNANTLLEIKKRQIKEITISIKECESQKEMTQELLEHSKNQLKELLSNKQEKEKTAEKKQ